ncbi:hypothetical protein RP20_CCG021729 [Aedes albopictus]|nr:hypothetical protein RP20_CCG021729 [Aedes albopictus]
MQLDALPACLPSAYVTKGQRERDSGVCCEPEAKPKKNSVKMVSLSASTTNYNLCAHRQTRMALNCCMHYTAGARGMVAPRRITARGTESVHKATVQPTYVCGTVLCHKPPDYLPLVLLRLLSFRPLLRCMDGMKEITTSFNQYGALVVDWPHKAESKSYFPPKGYAFLLFQEERGVQKLIETCHPEDDKLYITVSSPTIKNKAVQIRPWRLADADYVLDASMPLDPRKTVFVGGVPRPLKAYELAMIMDRLYGGVCYAGIDTDPELKYPKGAGRVAFSNQQSYIAAISARFVQLQHGDIDKRVEVKPYVLDDQMCDECQGQRCGGKFAPFFCANVTCLQYYCEHCWAHIHSRSGREYHKPLVKEGADRPRAVPFRCGIGCKPRHQQQLQQQQQQNHLSRPSTSGGFLAPPPTRYSGSSGGSSNGSGLISSSGSSSPSSIRCSSSIDQALASASSSSFNKKQHEDILKQHQRKMQQQQQQHASSLSSIGSAGAASSGTIGN